MRTFLGLGFSFLSFLSNSFFSEENSGGFFLSSLPIFALQISEEKSGIFFPSFQNFSEEKMFIFFSLQNFSDENSGLFLSILFPTFLSKVSEESFFFPTLNFLEEKNCTPHPTSLQNLL